MKYLKTMRNIHLWIGLILAVFIFIEAFTGLLQAEPWLMGVDEEHLQGHFTNQIHEGKLGQLNMKWLIDVTAAGLILLTVTGVYLSVPFLKIRRKR